MKITFEGKTIGEILDAMNDVLAAFPGPKEKAVIFEGPGPDVMAQSEAVDKPVDKPVEKPGRTAKQLENDEKLRARAKAKAAAKKVPKEPMPPEVREAPPPASAEGMDPAEVVRVRQKTIEELQAAYANGFQKEVFELLSRFGNGAKSFRELPPESFVPIREAIDNGALT